MDTLEWLVPGEVVVVGVVVVGGVTMGNKDKAP